MKRHLRINVLKLFSFGLLLASTHIAVGQSYCASGASTTYDSKCDRVRIQGNTLSLDNKSNPTTCETYSDFTSFVAVDLTAGQDYTIILTNGTCGGAYTRYGNAWIDYNQDGVFDTWEMLGKGNVGSSTTGYEHVINFKVPCNIKSGNTRMRCIVIEGTATNPCGSYTYGETEDYTVNLGISGTLAAGFFMVDTAYVKTAVALVNSNPEGYFYHGWDIGDDGKIDYTTVNATHKFNSPGSYCVRLYSENCLGRDSVVHCLTIIKPTQPPVADFIADRGEVELYNTFKLTDLSTNGAIYWDWFLYLEVDSAGTRIDGDDYPDLRGGDETVNQNPEIFTAKAIPGFPDVGKWCVGLTASNDVGASVTLIKKNYVEVIKGCDVEMGPGTVTGIPGNVITCEAGTLKNKDDGSGNYSSPEANLDALIAPCGAKTITFTFDQWKVKANVNLKVYDGQNANGTPLHPKSGFTASDTPSAPLVAQSGALYFLWNSSGTQTDKGFLGHWTSTIGSQAPPTAKFSSPDTLYNAVYNTFTNTSLNAGGEVFFDWTIDGTSMANTRDMEQIFLSNATYNVCLNVETCAGKDKWCKNVVVSPITSKAKLDFTADIRRPKAGEKTTFTAETDKANSFQWTFFPGTTVQFVDGTNANSRNPVVTFSAPGNYTVSLKGWNNLSKTDSAVSYNQVIRNQYIIVIDYCKPLISVTSSADIATTRVLLEDRGNPKKALIDNSSSESDYTDYTDDDNVRPANLTFGGVYDITLFRKTSVNKMSRKIWIDWNIDGDFDDYGELVATETPANSSSFTTSFTVPDLSSSFEGKTRMRIGTSYNADPNMPCGASSGVKNANRIGEFEDYTLILSNDNTFPYITMNGDDTVYVEVGKTYTDPGAIATDPTEGDITSRLITTSDVDATAAGIYYVTYCVKDASGNEAPCKTRVVYVVVDQSAPVLALKGNNPEYVEVITGSYTEAGWTATDVTDGNLETAVQVSGTVNIFKIGTYNLVYSVQDAQGNLATAKRTVIVRDQVLPTITNDDITVKNGRNVVQVQLQSVFVDRTVPNDNYNNGTFGPMFEYKITPANAQGEADVDTRVKGTTIVTYSATDESGNSATLIIDYVVEDFIAPVISLNTLDSVYHPVNSKYTPVEASVTDNFYNETQISLVRTSNVNPYILGKYTDTYTATDASGNQAIKKRWVIVYDSSAPEISGKFGPIARIGLFSNVSLLDYLKIIDNYDSPSDLFKNISVIDNDMNVYEEGFYAATFETTDKSGNRSLPFTLYIDVNRKYETINGISDVENGSLLKVYPNPSEGIFNVLVDLPTSESVTIQIYDVVGNLVQNVTTQTMQSGSFNVDMSSNSSGVYFVKMMVADKVYNQRIIIK
ncbi:MAG: DUF5011 domain-containing protein [Bacteroidetes bacterium]|nr:DUF5011 domain-containing protein [Bacteroidota bacterium]